MRLWTLHPRHLDGAGLVAVWREGLLARAVLSGATRGYRHHPQLERFRATRGPLGMIDAYLVEIWAEAKRRGYRFDRSKLGRCRAAGRIEVFSGQVAFEWKHLKRKLRLRDPARYREARRLPAPEMHPLFLVVDGPVAPWERGNILP